MEALAEVNRVVAADQPLDATVGDEFQAVYPTHGAALLAALLVRLHLPEPVDCRCGIGHGTLDVFDPDRRPRLQDGPAWWAARDAIDEVAARAGRPRLGFLRTWYADSADPAAAAAVNAFLLCRDQMVDRLSVSSRTLLRHTLLGHTQEEMAQAEGITQSAVSQRLASSGVHAIKEAHDVMTGERR